MDASATDEGPEAVDEMLGCLLEVPGRPRMEPDLPVRVTGGGMLPRADEPFWAAFEAPAILSVVLPTSRVVPCPVGIGNWVNLKSLEADSRLLWRSSKLTEGRKS